MKKKVIRSTRCITEHEWGPSAAPGYEICQFCKEVRKKIVPILPPVPVKKEGNQ